MYKYATFSNFDKTHHIFLVHNGEIGMLLLNGHLELLGMVGPRVLVSMGCYPLWHRAVVRRRQIEIDGLGQTRRLRFGGQRPTEPSGLGLVVEMFFDYEGRL